MGQTWQEPQQGSPCPARQLRDQRPNGPQALVIPLEGFNKNVMPQNPTLNCHIIEYNMCIGVIYNYWK